MKYEIEIQSVRHNIIIVKAIAIYGRRKTYINGKIF